MKVFMALLERVPGLSAFPTKLERLFCNLVIAQILEALAFGVAH